MYMTSPQKWNRDTPMSNADVPLGAVAPAEAGTIIAPSLDNCPNLHSYVHADPINFTDPTGLITMEQCQAMRSAELAKEEGSPVVCGGGGKTSPHAGTLIRTTPGGVVGTGRGAQGGRGERQAQQNRRRSLTHREKRILMCNGATQNQVDTFIVSDGIPFPVNLNTRVDGITLHPISGVSVANLRNGIVEMTSSTRGHFSLIAHEFAHHIQYKQGMTIPSYVGEWINSGYYDSMYEGIARDFAEAALDNWDSGKCR